MIVHLGVVAIAVAFAASSSYDHEAELRLSPGDTATVAGHEITYLGTRTVERPEKTSIVADVRIDGGRSYAPALSKFPNGGQAIGTPSVRTSISEDVYLALLTVPEAASDPITLRVIVQPLVVWLWIGGGIMAFGTALAAWPGSRRRPTDPVSAPIRAAAERDPDPDPEPDPVAVG
jgi:cytochrome c-type biogenesis protein CcmF